MLSKIWEKVKESFYTAATAVVLVFLVIAIVWVSIVFVPKIFTNGSSYIATSLSSLFVGNDIDSVSLNKNIISSGEGFSIIINKESSTNGAYVISYSCLDNVYLETRNGNINSKIECQKDFFPLNKTSAIYLAGFSLSQRYVNVPIVVGFQPANSNSISRIGEVNIAITNENIQTPSTTTATTTATTTKPIVIGVPAPTYYSKADLSINLLSVGILDKTTSQFTQTNTIYAGNTVAIKFEIKNIGGTNTGTWNFKADLPSLSEPNFISDSQQSLKPGDKIQYILSFDNPINGNVVVSADYLNQVDELSSNNNILTIPLSVGTYNYINPNDYQYYNNYYYNNYGTLYTWTSLSGSCVGTVNNGNNVEWTANGSGGNGYYTFAWSGTDNLSGSNRIVNHYYDDGPGTKTANVIITSNGISITKSCSVSVNGNYYTSNFPDLSVRIISTGIIGSDGQFYTMTSIPKGSNIAVKAEITNMGPSTSNSWTLIGSISPSIIGYTYKIDRLNSLAPGETLVYTIIFYNTQVQGTNYINVQADPGNVINDTNRSNNTANTTVNIY